MTRIFVSRPAAEVHECAPRFVPLASQRPPGPATSMAAPARRIIALWEGSRPRRPHSTAGCLEARMRAQRYCTDPSQSSLVGAGFPPSGLSPVGSKLTGVALTPGNDTHPESSARWNQMLPFHGAVLRARAGRPCTQPLLTTASLGAYPPTCLAVGFGAARTIVPTVASDSGMELKRVAAIGEPQDSWRRPVVVLPWHVSRPPR